MTFTDRPDWVMAGTPASPLQLGQPGQVAILASTELSRAELEAAVRTETFSYRDYVVLSDTTYTLTVAMKTFTLVVADTYPEALAHLLRTWVPKATGPQSSIANAPTLSLTAPAGAAPQ